MTGSHNFDQSDEEGEDKTEYFSRPNQEKKRFVHEISIKLKNPLPIPLTLVTVTVYGIEVESTNRYSPPKGEIPPHTTVTWFLNVTVSRAMSEHPSLVPEEQNSQVDNIVFSSDKEEPAYSEKKAVFVLVNSNEISRIDGFILL